MASLTNYFFTPPAKQEAIIAGKDGKAILSRDEPCPPLRSDRLYIRTEAVAINRSNTKMQGDFITPLGIFGADYAGTVIAIGSAVTNVQVGDHVCAAQHSMYEKTPEYGAFGQYNVTNGAVWLKLPPSMSIEAGASLGAGISTAGLAIRVLGLPLPDAPTKNSTRVLVYGGSTATGTIAIQLLKL
jgi:NADPH:quinone reductase-like Zn-dependent oxidoreductase